MTVKNNDVTVAKKPKSLLEVLHKDITDYTNTEFQVAVGYDPVSAVQSAIYALEQVQTPQKTKALSVVGGNSVKNAVRQMVTMGLYPDKKQGYFIAYGDQMTFMPSYMGYQMILRRDYGVRDVKAIVVYEGDQIATHIINGEERIVDGSHIRKSNPFEKGATNLSKVVGAYAIAQFKDRQEKHEIMNMEQIQKAWDKAKTTNVHKDFADQMIKRTILNRLAKGIINSNVDNNARLEQIAQSIYQSDGYDYDEKNPLDVDMSKANITEVSPFDDEEENEEVVEVVDVVEDLDINNTDDPF